MQKSADRPTGESLENPLCPSCRFNELQRFLAAGKPTEARHCSKWVPLYPVAVHCKLFEREPGSDDGERIGAQTAVSCPREVNDEPQ